MIKFKHKGDLKKTESFLKKLKSKSHFQGLDGLAQRGVDALSSATPIDSGLTSQSWGYVIKDDGDKVTIAWTNDNVVDDVNIAIILQYGHATGTGGWVEGEDYINPAIKKTFDDIAKQVWKEVTAR